MCVSVFGGGRVGGVGGEWLWVLDQGLEGWVNLCLCVM